MPHLHRFYLPALDPEKKIVVLADSEAHHALHVVRVRIGDDIALFDGQGRELLGEVTHATRREVTVEVRESRQVLSLSHSLTLCMGWLKRDKHVEFAIRHGVELGVTQFVFFRAAHSERAPQVDEAWERLAVEACKQCGRLWLPAFRAFPSLSEVLGVVSGSLLVATMDAPPASLSTAVDPTSNTLFVGPEGDFTPDELESLWAAGGRPISLGAATFRSEVAAMVASTLVLYEMGAIGVRSDD